MTDRFVGPGGSDGSSGLTWALRKLTLNGVEDTPVVAGDDVYCGPGVYRESLTADISGTSGNPITYIADVTGENTDGIGGVVRISGSDDDITATRGNCIIDGGTQRNYRTFRGFLFDMYTDGQAVYASNAGTDWIFEDCIFGDFASYRHMYITGANQADWTLRRCMFNGAITWGEWIIFTHGSTLSDVGHVLENCVFLGHYGGSVNIDRVGGITIRDTSFLGGLYVVKIVNALAGGQTVTLNNCSMQYVYHALKATAVGEITEDYNTFWANHTDRVNTSTGSNSIAYPSLFRYPVLLDGFKFPPPNFGELSEWSPIKRIAGTSQAADDFFGITRPTTAAKKSWGAVQFLDAELESGTVQSESYGRVLNDAGLVLFRRVPCTNVSTTVTLQMRRQTNYAGSVPRMVIKQPGVADRTTDMTAAVDTWEELSDTFTPAANPKFFEVWVESRNTATSGSYKVFYDTMGVS